MSVFEPRMPSKKYLWGGGEDHLGGRHRQVQQLHDGPEHQDRPDDGGNHELPDQQGTGVSTNDLKVIFNPKCSSKDKNFCSSIG